MYLILATAGYCTSIVARNSLAHTASDLLTSGHGKAYSFMCGLCSVTHPSTASYAAGPQKLSFSLVLLLMHAPFTNQNTADDFLLFIRAASERSTKASLSSSPKD